MSSAVEARNLIVEIAGPVRLGDRVKPILGKVAALSGLPERRIRGIWHREARAILAEEIKALQRAKEEAIHARNVETRARLEMRRAALAGDVEAEGF